MSEVKKVNVEKDELKVDYCIPTWLRDEQIKLSVERFKGRILPYEGLRNEPIAVVCFGPSLNDTWEEIKKFKYVISCSGSHKFLMDRGITPTYHVEVDPRAHKIQLIGENISQDTEFLMASCCHPKVFDHLEAHNAKITLWHTYSGEKKEMIPLTFPRNEWILTGGANVGLRALSIARFLGFTDIHVFGMDGSFPKDGEKHADKHPNQQKNYIMAEFDGAEYATTTAFLYCAKETFHEIEMLPDVSIHFYGDGLIQRMAIKKTKDGSILKKKEVKLAFLSKDTISQDYAEQNKKLHENNPVYGVSVMRHKKIIEDIYKSIEARSLLDYGCGKGLLAKNLDFPIWEYDPAITGKDKPPRPADLVVCVDVLEHIEPEYLESVLKDIARCILKVGYFVINTGKSVKTLPDGRNTHLIQQGKEWWTETLSKYFLVPTNGVKEKNRELHIIVAPLGIKNYNHDSFVIRDKEEVKV